MIFALPAVDEGAVPDQTDIVYFMRGPNGLVKVGTTIDGRKRFESLRLMCPVRLDLVGWFEGGRSWEICVHQGLAGTCSHGEWFRPSTALLKFIEIANAPYQYLERAQQRLAVGQLQYRLNPDADLRAPKDRLKWLGGYVRRTSRGQVFIIERKIRGTKFHVSTRRTTEREAMRELEKFESNPIGYRPMAVVP